MVLGHYGYGTGPFDGVLDEKTKAAVRAYQKNKGIPPTGDPLEWATFEQLTKDEGTMQTAAVILPSKHVSFDFWDEGYVSAKGTWTLTNDVMGIPLQTSEIDCDRKRNICVEAIALLEKDQLLSVALDMYEIERWDKHEIVTKPLKTSICTRYIRRFNRIQQSVTGIRSTISKEGFCNTVEQKDLYIRPSKNGQKDAIFFPRMWTSPPGSRSGLGPDSLSWCMAT